MTPGQGHREATSRAEGLRVGVGFSRKCPGEGRQGRHSGGLLAEETRGGQAGDTGHGATAAPRYQPAWRSDTGECCPGSWRTTRTCGPGWPPSGVIPPSP